MTSWFEGSLLAVLMAQAGAPHPMELEGLQPRETLRGLVVAFERRDREHRVEGRHRRVRSDADLDPALEHGADGVSGHRACGPETLLVHAAALPPEPIEGGLDADGQPEHRRSLDLVPGRQHEVLDPMASSAEVPPLA